MGCSQETKGVTLLSKKGGVMTIQPLEQQTYLPGSDGDVADVLSFIKAHENSRGARPEPRYFLAGPEEGDQVELPATVYRVLLQVLEALEAGKAVTVAPQSQLLTTQQAADLLGVSRPTVVKLIDDGELPAETPGTRRRLVKLDDVLAHRARRREAQYRALLETSVDDYDLDESPESVAENLRRVRAEVAARRRARGSR
jgi:excisionase family DNA binding protein